jgi:hypothetical protein
VSQPTIIIALARSRGARQALLAVACLLALVPMLMAATVAGVFAGAEEAASCGVGGPVEIPAAGAIGQGLYAQPLRLVPGRRYEVGATDYGGPADPSSGSYGAIADPGQSYLPAHPDTFAELSVLASNPANGGHFTFADANALGSLPYMSELRVWHDGRSALLYKRDIGYGQGPGQQIENGQPYRLDLWWQAAQSLGVSKSAVTVALAPASGAASSLEELPEAASPQAQVAEACPLSAARESAPLPLAPGTRTRVLASGLAAAGEGAPRAVKAMVAAGNRLYGSAYLYGGGHGASLDALQGAYDCSSAVSYLLHWGGVLGSSALDSSALALYGQPGPGRYVTIYANPSHAFVYVAGLRLDTVEDPAYDSGPNAGRPGARWRVSPTVPGWAAWTVRHPAGL